MLIEGSLEAKLPTKWKDGKAQAGRNSDVEKVRREKIRQGQDAGARKGRKVVKSCVFPSFVAPESRKLGSVKRRVRRQLAR